MAFLGLDLGSWLLLLLGLCLAAYFYLTRSYGIWEKKGLFSFPPTVLFGNNGPVLLGKVHMSEYHDDIYKKLDGHKYERVLTAYVWIHAHMQTHISYMFFSFSE